jgi:CheY-like chemotaxis protein
MATRFRWPSGQQGVDAFEKAQQEEQPFDVVITDLGMPSMDGVEVAQQIKGRSPGTPVVLLTGLGTLVGEDATNASAFDAILSKPPRLAELMHALSKASSSRLRPSSARLANVKMLMTCGDHRPALALKASAREKIMRRLRQLSLASRALATNIRRDVFQRDSFSSLRRHLRNRHGVRRSSDER